MGQEYLLDSNAIIGYLAAKIPVHGMEAVSSIVNQTPRISVISQIEVLRFNVTPETEAILADFINASIIYSLNTVVIRRTIDLCKQSRIKLPDAIIAATALTENLTLVTCNINDYKHIHNLLLFNPWESNKTGTVGQV